MYIEIKTLDLNISKIVKLSLELSYRRGGFTILILFTILVAFFKSYNRNNFNISSVNQSLYIII